MDIPLPDDPPLSGSVENSLADIPVPEDTNRYSPSLPIEDDPPELKDISSISLPSESEKALSIPIVSVLGKEAAKKRLLAFTQSKQSLISLKRKTNQIILEANPLKDNDLKASNLPKKKKKGVLDKARDTISEIEELKRRENEVMETMQVLFPMWGNLDKKTTVTSLIMPDGIGERSEKMESVVEKLLSKKSRQERKEQEKQERLEERKKKREKRDKEIRRLMPKSWEEFNKNGFKAYHFRRQKFKLEKLSESSKTKDRSRSHEHERESSRRINLLDTPMVLKKPLVVAGINNEVIEFPSWAVRYTNVWPQISYCLNPKYETKRFISRKEMLNSVPDNIYAVIKRFLSSSVLNKFKEKKIETSRTWWDIESFLTPEGFSNSPESSNEKNILESDVKLSESDLKTVDFIDHSEGSDKVDVMYPYSVSDSLPDSSEEHASDIEKSQSVKSGSEMDIDKENKSFLSQKEEQNDENLASEYEQFIKTIGPTTDSEEIEGKKSQDDEVWSQVSGDIKQSVVDVKKEKKNDDSELLEDQKKLKEKTKKTKKKSRKRSHSSDSSSSETSSNSSRSSSSSSRSSSTSSSSTSSSSSGSSSSSSTSSSDSSSTSNDSSSESSSSSSSGTSSSSENNSFQKKSKKNKKKRVHVRKKIIVYKTNKSKKAFGSETEEGNFSAEINEEDSMEVSEKSDDEDMHNEGSRESCSNYQEGTNKIIGINDASNMIGVGKNGHSEKFESKDFSSQSRSTDEDVSNLSSKSSDSEPLINDEQKNINDSLNWNSVEDSMSQMPIKQDRSLRQKVIILPEGKRHFNMDMFQEPHNTIELSKENLENSPNDSTTSVPVSFNNFKEESKEGNDNITVITQGSKDSALKSLERYSPTADDEEDEDVDFLSNNTSVGGSTMEEASQLVSFGVNSASEEARMLDIPLPPPIEAPSEVHPTSFHNILQLPSSPSQIATAKNLVEAEVKKKNIVLVGKSPVARLTFGKQVMKLKPMNIFSTEDSDSEALPEKTLGPSDVFETNDNDLQSLEDHLEQKLNKDSSSASNNYVPDEGDNNRNNKEIISSFEKSNAMEVKLSSLEFETPQSKKSRWDQECSKNEKNSVSNVDSSFLSNKSSSENKAHEVFVDSGNKFLDIEINVKSTEKSKYNKIRKEFSRSPSGNEKKRRRERSLSSERDRRRRAWSPREDKRFSREVRKNFRNRSRSKDQRSRRDSADRKKSSPRSRSYRSPSNDGDYKKSFDKTQRPENIGLNTGNEPSTTMDVSWNKESSNLSEVKESYNKSPKKNFPSEWDSSERNYSSPPCSESPKKKMSPVLKESTDLPSPHDSPPKRKSPDHFRRKESPIRRRSPENRKDSPGRRLSPRRSPVPRKRLTPDRKKSPYSPRRGSPIRRRSSPDKKRSSSPYKRRISPSPECKYSSRYSRKSPVKPYSNSPTREKWKWEEEISNEKKNVAEDDVFHKWDYDASQNDQVNDYQTSLADSTISDSELVKDPPSPKRMSLDERLRIELGHNNANNIESEQPANIPSYHNFYYPPPAAPEHVNYYPPHHYNMNTQPPPGLPPDWNPSVHPPQLPNKLVQVGNVLQVVPREMPAEPVFSAPPPKIIRNHEVLPPKVLQVGNMLQVVPSQEQLAASPLPGPQNAALPFVGNSTVPSPVAAPLPTFTTPPPPQTQPVSIISLPFPPGSPSILMKLEEKEKRKKEKELRKQRKEQKAARRMLRKAMMKKRLAKANELENDSGMVKVVQNENSELETSKVSVILPSPDKGILLGLKDTTISTSSKRKSVSFADGIKPGEGTSPSGGEEHPLSPPPLIRKPAKKRKKRKVKVRIIRIDNSNAKEEETEDDLSPPPPPPGTPPPEAYIEYTASGRYLYPVTNQTFAGNQDGGSGFPPLPTVTANQPPSVQFPTPPLPQQR